MLRHLLSLIFLATLIAGCDPQPAEPVRPVEGAHIIMPLKVGNRWIGKWTLYGDDGSIISTTLDTLAIISEEKVGGETWFRGSDSGLYTNRADGLWLWAPAIGDRPVLQAKYPAVAGETFNAQPALAVLPEGRLTEVTIAMLVFDTAGAVSTVAGSYRSHIYGPRILEHPDLPLGARGWRRYYAPNVGPVRIDWPDGTRRWELVSATMR